jgi:hypothetical protein
MGWISINETLIKETTMEFEIIGIFVKEPPNRALELRCKIKSDQNNDVVILQLWAKVRTTKYITLVDGQCFKYYDMPVIPRQSPATLSIFIPLDEKILNSLEVSREGGDLHIEIESKIVAAPITQSPPPPGFSANEHQLMMRPVSFSLLHNGNTTIAYRIPQSDWVKYLLQMQYSEIELFEIPVKPFSSDPELKRGLESLKKAQEQFRRGHWKETLHNCRMAFEAAAAEVGQTSDKKQNFQKLSGQLGGGEKSKRLNDLIGTLSDYAQLGRHEDFPSVSINREDALAVLRLTLSVFDLIAQ